MKKVTLNETDLTPSELIARGVTLNKFADPLEGARENLSFEEAEEIAKEDPGLIWLEIKGLRIDVEDTADLISLLNQVPDEDPQTGEKEYFEFIISKVI